MAADPADAGLYPGKDGPTGGWSGSDTSRERAQHEEASGARRARQHQVYDLVRRAGRAGMTDPEVQEALGIGHGASSGALTRLHREGFLARLTERRKRNAVYVLPQFVGERPTAPYRPNRAAAARGLEVAAQHALVAATEARDEYRRVGPAASVSRSAYLLGKRDALVTLASELRWKADDAAQAQPSGDGNG